MCLYDQGHLPPGRGLTKGQCDRGTVPEGSGARTHLPDERGEW
ncbi:MAG: hypothetical protein A4E31_00015 [Methanomassiliicoccales archaeon PtaU1.Bin030]|nr:MAG: hypothetical protein A4E31_00015 [Methanomassiliicoccales archaeon PtaU1.Bin030]